MMIVVQDKEGNQSVKPWMWEGSFHIMKFCKLFSAHKTFHIKSCRRWEITFPFCQRKLLVSHIFNVLYGCLVCMKQPFILYIYIFGQIHAELLREISFNFYVYFLIWLFGCRLGCRWMWSNNDRARSGGCWMNGNWNWWIVSPNLSWQITFSWKCVWSTSCFIKFLVSWHCMTLSKQEKFIGKK